MADVADIKGGCEIAIAAAPANARSVRSLSPGNGSDLRTLKKTAKVGRIDADTTPMTAMSYCNEITALHRVADAPFVSPRESAASGTVSSRTERL